MSRPLLFAFCLILFGSCRDKFSMYPIPEVNLALVEETTATGEFLDQNLRKYPENIDIAIQKLRYLKDRRWSEDSESLILGLLTKDSGNYVLHELAADYYLSRSMLGTALKQANIAEVLGAKSAAFYDTKAILFSRLGKYEEAIDYINKAILINRSDFNAYYTKGKIYLTLRDTISALKFMETSLVQNKNDDKVLYEISEIYEGMKDYSTAETLIENAIAQAPQKEHLYIKKAQIQRSAGRESDARITLQSAFQKDESRVESGQELAGIYFDQKQYDSAIFVTNQVIERDSTELRAILLKARAYDKKYFYNNAVINYELLLAIDSTHQEAQEEMRKVKGKIAYLRKLKESRAAMPVFDLVSPKKNN